MLDELYGLLEPAESTALAAHVASCPSCTALMVQAKADQALIQNASTSSFPALKFTPPADLPTVVPSEYAEPRVKTTRQAWIGWAVAAGIMLVAAGTLGPTVRHTASYLANSQQLASARKTLRESESHYNAAKSDYDATVAAAERKAEEAKRLHNEVV